MREPKRKYVMVFQVEQNHGSPQFTGRICYLNEDGDLRNPLGDRFEDGGEYADFGVTAYQVTHDSPRPWGFHYGYLQPFYVETHRAELMVKLLRRVDRGMERFNSERGYVSEGNFHDYALRVAETLGIKDFYVRNTDRARAVSGQTFRHTDGSGVQDWIHTQVHAHLETLGVTV